MSRFAVLVMCAQACLIQIAVSQQCGCNSISYGSSGLLELEKISLGAPSCNSASLYSAPIGVGVPSYSNGYGASYGGTGTGQVGATGDIGASGTTVVVGSVPVLGTIEISGKVPASGSVSISGQCGCGCSWK